ncbi:DUF4321 domain-containing protein [Xylanibacillus composti]|uniref:DUF4321 domain-containing protein n=1 Tax=Xylanibacillus composti TaxID=1572762 RepID=UPI001BD0CF3A|nr:DUF4321 domain-containing protein [Xylanibacillus composti]
MKKNTFTLLFFLAIGLLVATIISELLTPVRALSFLTKSAAITWEPKANFQVIQYDLYIQVKLNLISIFGLIAAFWFYRKL